MKNCKNNILNYCCQIIFLTFLYATAEPSINNISEQLKTNFIQNTFKLLLLQVID
jgi:hypothetical protein